MKNRVISLFACLTLLLFLAKGVEAKESVVGKECIDCHEDQVNAFQKDIHARYTRHSDQLQKGCQDCHGSAAAHMDDPSVKNIKNPAKLDKKKADAICLKCHQKDKKRLLWKGSEHDFNDVGCKNCHSIHAPKGASKIKEKTQKELCIKCHRKISYQLRLRSRHPIKEEKLLCTDCHNPHGSPASKLIDGPNIREKCLSCHAEKKGPFVFEHEPVQEDCMICHKPHGSNNDSLLVVKENTLCSRCHDHGRHQSKTGFEGDPWVYNRGCVNCHNNVHGSNHPSGELFMR